MFDVPSGIGLITLLATGFGLIIVEVSVHTLSVKSAAAIIKYPPMGCFCRGLFIYVKIS